MSTYTAHRSSRENLIAMHASLDSAEQNLKAAIAILEAEIAVQPPRKAQDNPDHTGLSRPPHAEAR